MVYRILIFLFCFGALFVPVYMFINYLSKKIYIFKESSDLQDEMERNKNTKKALKKEISNKIDTLKKEQEKLKNIKD